jgi:uncharacterized protein involved in response to NO
MTSTLNPAIDPQVAEAVRRESQLRRLLMAFIATGLLFMLLPGTFLGVWNLISISGRHSLAALSPEWIQAHGHAQIFGWVGSFILGIGFFSISKMARLPSFSAGRGWICWVLWTGGVLARWATNVYLWRWEIVLPVSAAMELAAYLIFFRTVSRHRPPGAKPEKRQTWMLLVIGAAAGLLLALVLNLASAVWLSFTGSGPALPHGIDQQLLVLSTFGFLVPFIWAFNARWLPVFLGLAVPSDRLLLTALAINTLSVAAGLAGYFAIFAALAMIGAVTAILALNIFQLAEHPAKIQGIHSSFPFFVRGAYVWLLIAAGLSMWAVRGDWNGGIWGASRHALTVGFVSTMIFAVGQRILPAFCGMRTLFSKSLMFGSLAMLNLGCFLRVASEIPAYEGYWTQAWSILPVSAVIELAAVTLFAVNLAVTLIRPPAYLSQIQGVAA